MTKKLFTYFFIMALNVPVILTTCISFFELNYEVSLVLDLEEETEDLEIKKDSEVKIIPNSTIFSNYIFTENQNKIIFIAKNYNSVVQKLDSPPPDSSL